MDLPLFAQAQIRPTDTAVNRLVDCLKGRGWLKASELKCRHGFNDRELRALANASDGRIVSGQKGYALIEDVTVEEANHFISWMRSQAAHMQRRAAAAQERLNRRLAKRTA